MAEPLEQQLVWDISAALASIEQLDTALGTVASNFEAALTAAVTGLSSASIEIDTSSLQSSVTDALSAISDPIAVEGDTSALDQSISDAVQPETVEVDGDATQVTQAIDEAAAVSPVVDVQGDISEAAAAIDALNTSPVTVDVDADTSQAQQEIDALTGAANQAAGGGGGGGLHGLEGAVLGVEAATGAAKGEVGGLNQVLGGLSSTLGTTVVAGAAFLGFVGEAVNLSADAEAQQRRFNDIFGESAAIVEHIDVGGLVISLKELGATSGTTEANLEASASRIGLLGKASGAAQPEVAKTAGNILGLAGALAVANPRLGDTATVADTISRALATGRTRSLIPYGISLSQTAIIQEALNETQKRSAAQLTGYDKLVAGVTLALDQQGNTLGTKYSDGVKNAQVQLRALKVDLEETLVAVGGPLLGPATQSLQDFIPVAEQIGVVLGKVAQDTLPLIASITPILSPLAGLLGLVGDGLDAIGPAGVAVGVALAIIIPDLVVASAGFASATVTATAFGVALDFATGPIGITIGILAALGAATHLFGGTAKDAGTDTGELVGIFDATGSSASSLQQRIAALTGGLDEYLKTQLTQGPVAQQGQVALHAFGNSYEELSTHLTQSTSDFFTWYASQRAAGPITDDTHKAILKLSDVLLDSRAALETSAEAQIHNAVQTGALSKAQADAAIKQTAVKKTTDDMTAGEKDYLSALKLLAPVIDASNKKTEETTFAQFQASDANKALVTAVQAGAIVLGDAKSVATQYNITQDQATEVIQNVEKSMDRAAAATLNRSSAYRELVGEIARGTIGEIDAQVALQQMGFSVDGAATAYKALASQIESAVKGIVGNLPSAGDAAKTWASDISTAFKQAADDAKNHTGNVKADLAALAADSDPAKFAANLIAQASSVVTFEANLKTLVGEGFGALAGFIAQQPFDVAGPLADKLAGDESKAKLVAAAVQLSQAVSGPEAQKFFNDNAAALGLDVGAQIANGIVVGAPVVNAASEQAAAGAAQHFVPDFSHRVDIATQAAAVALTNDASIGQAAGQKGLEALAAFERAYGPVSSGDAAKIALKGAHDAIAADPTLATASKTKGDEVGGAFKPKIDASTQAALDAAAPVLRNVGKLTVAAGNSGHSVGVGFDSGLVEGLNEPDQTGRISSAASGLGGLIESAIKRRLGIASPSTVGIVIGQNVVQGVVVGLGDTGIMTTAGTAVGTAIATAGHVAVSSVIAGFNDATTIANATAELERLVARASTPASTSAAQSSFNSFVSSVISQLPQASAEISSFASNLSSALAANATQFQAYKKAVAAYREDAAVVVKLTTETGIRFGILAAAQQHYNEVLANTPKKASDAQKAALKEAKDALSAAQQDFDHFASQLDSAQKKSDTATKKFREESAKSKASNQKLDRAQDPASFTRSLNAQTRDEAAFEQNLKKLLSFGDTDLAAELAKSGVDAAGALAAGFASSKSKAKAAEAAVDHAKAFSTSYQHFLETQFAPKAQATIDSVTGTGSVHTVAAPVGSTGSSAATANQRVSANIAVTPPAQPQILELDLRLELPDGSFVSAKADVPVPAPTPGQGKTVIKTSVVGKVNA